MSLVYPRPLARHELRLLILPASVGLALGLLYLAWRWGIFLQTGAFLPFTLQPSLWFALTLFAVRFRAEPPDSPHRRQLALMSGALLLFPGIVAGVYGLTFDLMDPGKVLAAVLLGLLWLGNANASGRPASRWSRDLALLTFGLLAVGLTINGNVDDPVNGGPFGVARALMVLGLAYAILRQQLLGLDLKVRWTIKQSTVAAAFVGVFFVASEGAQAFFAESTNSSMMGILAAGALVFAIAPLQRAAERVASAAVPGGGSGEVEGPGSARDFYRRQLALAYADGTVGRKERAMLRELRAHLGLSAEDAERLEAEVSEGAKAGEGRRAGRGAGPEARAWR
jgi:hypothetical protein